MAHSTRHKVFNLVSKPYVTKAFDIVLAVQCIEKQHKKAWTQPGIRQAIDVIHIALSTDYINIEAYKHAGNINKNTIARHKYITDSMARSSLKCKCSETGNDGKQGKANCFTESFIRLQITCSVRLKTTCIMSALRGSKADGQTCMLSSSPF